MRAAEWQGIDTVYFERHLVTAELGLELRPRLPWFNHDAQKRELFGYVAESCRAARHDLEELLRGSVRLPHSDDTQVGEPLVPLYPDLKGSPIEGRFFRDQRGRPMFVISVHSPSRRLERFFASPAQHIESYTVGGGSRWTIEESAVWEAFHKDPEARRVGWDGWCGHLIRDLHSMGGSGKDNTVICLESPRIREAIDDYIRRNVPRFHENPQLLYDIMAYELSYMCYCDRSQKMFREWLEHKHGSIERVNRTYGASYHGFDEISGPPVKNARPLPETNRALWYDWARFNMDRFTDHLLWVRGRIHALDPRVPLAAGGSSYMLSGSAGTSGIDEERIVNEVDDVIIHEGAGSTLGMDLQLAFSEARKPLADPEMALDSVHDLLPHALHGKSVMQFYHWPAQPQNEYFHLNAAAFGHSWDYSLAEVSELLRATLDARRLGPEIAAFVDTPAEVAILYSQTATVQLPPEMLTWSVTPYLAELGRTYEAARCLDARTTFVTERQIEKGWLARYRLLLIPAVRNLPVVVFERILDYASSGGRVVVVPESLLGDEYNRPKDYLSRLGVTVIRTERPLPGAPGAMVQGYDQSFTQEVVYLAPAPLELGAASGFPAGLRTQGLRQSIRVATSAQLLASYPGAAPAVVRISTGRGAVYYLASSLEERSYARLLDAVFQEAGVSRPVRVRPSDSATWRLEARPATMGGRKLFYVINSHDARARFRIEAPGGFFRSLRDLREVDSARSASVELTLTPRQTAIYELF
jgi:beta-galactosidase GanA